jgi:hypothetical protein
MRRSLVVVVVAGLVLGIVALLQGYFPLPAPATPLASAAETPRVQATLTFPEQADASPSPQPSLGSPLPLPTGRPSRSSVAVSLRPSPAAPPSKPETIFTEQVPQHPSQRWAVPYELGTRFSTTVDGTITAVRVFGAQTESGLHAVRIWHWDSATLLAGPYEWEYAGPGWHELTLPTPLHIQARTDYVVAVSTGSDAAHDFVSTVGGFSEPVLNAHLVTYEGSGLGTQALGDMPTWHIPENRNFFRDVVFVPGETVAAAPAPSSAPVGMTDATYYVATNGDDAWSGALPAPNAQGTDGPWRTIQHAAGSLQPGDTVYVRGGTYYEWVWLYSSYSGTETAPKTFAAYPGEHVTLEGAVYPTQWQLHAGNIWWTDASGIDFNWEGQPRLVWQDDVWLQHSDSLGAMTEGTWWYDTSTQRLYVWLRGNATPSQHEIAVSSLRNAFHLELTSWIVLDGFYIEHYYRGISQMDSVADQGLSMEGLSVRNCVIEHVGEGIGLAGATFGTWGFTHRSLIEHNVIRDTQSDAIWAGSGEAHVVRYNTISDVKQAWYRGFVSAAIILGNADDSIVEGNVISDVHALGIDVEHFYDGGYGNRNIIRRNSVYDVGGLVNTEAGPALRNQLVNNTIYNGSDRGIAVIEGSPGQSRGLLPQDTLIQNNIFSNLVHWGIFNEGQNTSADYNLYWQTQGGVAYWEDTTYFTLADLQSIGQEMFGVAGDPLFVSLGGDFRLDEMSPAIDAGSNEDAPIMDYWGTPRPWDGDGDSIAVVDIGVHEWTGPLRLVHLPLILSRYSD